jgi:hypothetical protein
MNTHKSYSCAGSRDYGAGQTRIFTEKNIGYWSRRSYMDFTMTDKANNPDDGIIMNFLSVSL